MDNIKIADYVSAQQMEEYSKFLKQELKNIQKLKRQKKLERILKNE